MGTKPTVGVVLGRRLAITEGFTLIEILVAMAMLVLIMGVLFSSHRAVTASIERLGPRAATERRARSVLNSLMAQVRCCYGGQADANSLTLKPPQTQNQRTAADLSVRAEEDLSLFRAGTGGESTVVLSLVTSQSRAPQGRSSSGLRRVRYRFDRAHGTLAVAEGRYTDGVSGQDLDEDSFVVLERVRAVSVECFDGRAWQREWDDAVQGGLPRAVRVEWTVEDEQGHEIHTRSGARILCLGGKKMASGPIRRESSGTDIVP
jgi:general secretion pathway protein J